MRLVFFERPMGRALRTGLIKILTVWTLENFGLEVFALLNKSAFFCTFQSKFLVSKSYPIDFLYKIRFVGQ
jgi:hypothetical protein